MNKNSEIRFKEKSSEKEILSGIKIIDKALFLKDLKMLVITDLQLGSESAGILKGVFLPEKNLEKIIEDLRKIFSQTGKLKTIVINGDVKHEFSRMMEQEKTEIKKLIEFLLNYCENLKIIKGNHDVNLEYFLNDYEIKMQNYLYIEKQKIFITHGDKLPEKNDDFNNSEIIIIGHEHPALTLRKSVKQETYKCFLKGNFEKKSLIVMPSFTRLTIGSDVLGDKLLSPFLKKGVEKFEAWLLEDKPYYFGKIKNI